MRGAVLANRSTNRRALDYYPTPPDVVRRKTIDVVYPLTTHLRTASNLASRFSRWNGRRCAYHGSFVDCLDRGLQHSNLVSTVSQTQIVTDNPRLAAIKGMGMVEVVELIGGPCDGVLIRLVLDVLPWMRDDELDAFTSGTYRRRHGVTEWAAVVNEPGIRYPDPKTVAPFDWVPFED